jgi:mannose-6-phosphate isomerase
MSANVDLTGAQLTDTLTFGDRVVLSSEANHRITRVTLLPGQSLPPQRLPHHCEHWFVVQGEAKVSVGCQHIKLHAGESISVPAQASHSITSVGGESLVYIEIQMVNPLLTAIF